MIADNCCKQIDRLKQQSEQHLRTTIYDDFEQQAWDLILGSASSALDLSKEDPRLVKRYDTSHISVGHKKFQPSPLGKQLLLARRMCEAGAGFVTVHCAGWDMHNDSNNPGIIKGMNMLGRAVDHAVAAFLDDLQARGLDQKITLVITGDFGRTPRLTTRVDAITGAISAHLLSQALASMLVRSSVNPTGLLLHQPVIP